MRREIATNVPRTKAIDARRLSSWSVEPSTQACLNRFIRKALYATFVSDRRPWIWSGVCVVAPSTFEKPAHTLSPAEWVSVRRRSSPAFRSSFGCPAADRESVEPIAVDVRVAVPHTHREDHLPSGGCRAGLFRMAVGPLLAVQLAFNDSLFRALPSVASGLVVLLSARLNQKPSPSARNCTALAGKPPTFVCLAK